MSKSAQEVLTRGMQCLQDQLGAVDAEYFISLIIRELQRHMPDIS